MVGESVGRPQQELLKELGGSGKPSMQEAKELAKWSSHAPLEAERILKEEAKPSWFFHQCLFFQNEIH